MIFPESRKKIISKKMFFILSADFFVLLKKKKYILEVLSVFFRVTLLKVIMQIFRKIMNYLKI